MSMDRAKRVITKPARFEDTTSEEGPRKRSKVVPGSIPEDGAMLGAIFDKRDDPYVQPGTSYQVQRQLQAHPELQTHSELQAHPEVQPRTQLHTPYRTMYLPYATHNAVHNRMWHIQNNGLEEQNMQQQNMQQQGNMALHQQTLDSVKEMLERHEHNMALQHQKTLDSVKEMLDRHGQMMQQQQQKKKEKAPKPLCLPLSTPSA